MMKKWIYDWMYRNSSVNIPWDTGPRSELVSLVESGQVEPCRAIDLGSGTGSNGVFLAEHGFDVTGVDFSTGAIEMGRERASEAGVEVDFYEDDLTKLKNTYGIFDLLVDYGTLDDIAFQKRKLYVENVLPMTRTGSIFLIYCFEWISSWLWNFVYRRLSMAMEMGEIEELFGNDFEIEVYAKMEEEPQNGLTWIVYLMTRK